RDVAFVLRAFAVENFDGLKVRALAIALRLRRALRPRRSEPLQGGAGGREVLLIPDRMRVRHRLAPIRHREIGIDLLRLAEAICRCGVFEIVQQSETAEERRLRSRGARVGERDFAETTL